MSLKKIKDINVRCEKCKKESKYPVYSKDKKDIYPLYCRSKLKY
jgi:hypothetical protein